MEATFLLGMATVLLFLVNIKRFRRTSKSVTYNDDFNPHAISEEYIRVMNERVEKYRLQQHE